MASLDSQQQPKLLTQVRQVARSEHYSPPYRGELCRVGPAVRAVLGQLQGEARIAGLLMYGRGLRLLEILQLRVKDIDFLMGQIVVRRAKGGKDRVMVLAEAAISELRAQAHLDRVRVQHEHDLERGAVGRSFPVRWTGSHLQRGRSGGGSLSFRRGAGIRTQPWASGSGIICTSP